MDASKPPILPASPRLAPAGEAVSGLRRGPGGAGAGQLHAAEFAVTRRSTRSTDF